MNINNIKAIGARKQVPITATYVKRKQKGIEKYLKSQNKSITNSTVLQFYFILESDWSEGNKTRRRAITLLCGASAHHVVLYFTARSVVFIRTTLHANSWHCDGQREKLYTVRRHF